MKLNKASKMTTKNLYGKKTQNNMLIHNKNKAV